MLAHKYTQRYIIYREREVNYAGERNKPKDMTLPAQKAIEIKHGVRIQESTEFEFF